jgi:hypothetical protein
MFVHRSLQSEQVCHQVLGPRQGAFLDTFLIASLLDIISQMFSRRKGWSRMKLSKAHQNGLPMLSACS